MTNDFSQIIRGQHLTEKASRLLADNQYVFKVHLKAHKSLIKRLIEEEFKVKVSAVNTAITGGKSRRYGKTTGKKSDWKKAYITLEKGYSINLDSSTTTKG
jgi:large subunit ribosomal protein L23